MILLQGLRWGAFPLSDIENDYIILNQSLCIYGTPVSVPRLKPGKEMAIHARGFHNRMTWFEQFLAKDEPEEEIKKGCVWLMKGFLRVGFEITMERERVYTRDLYRCYETFSKYYPEKEPDMREVLYLALNPVSDRAVIKKVVDLMGKWLIQEIPKYFDISKS